MFHLLFEETDIEASVGSISEENSLDDDSDKMRLDSSYKFRRRDD